MQTEIIAQSIGDFCRRFGVGRTLAYQEIQRGRLRAIKLRNRTLIREDDARAWLEQYGQPIQPKPAEAPAAA